MRALIKTGAAICLSVSLLAFSGPAARASVIVQRDAAASTTALELWFRAPSAGYDSQNPGIARLALTALAASRPSPHGTSLAEYVKALGGTLSINAYADLAMVGVSVPSWQGASAAKHLAAAYFTPSISDDGMKAAVRDCAVAGTESRFDADRLLQDALFAHVFESGPAHYAPTPQNASDYAKIAAPDVKAFAARAFAPSNAIVSAAGAIDDAVLAPFGRAAQGAPAQAPLDSALSNRPADVTLDAAVEGLGVAWTGPGITDEKNATAMDFIADYLFDPDHGTLANALPSKSQVLINGQFITLHDPGVLLVTVSGTGSADMRQNVLDAVSALQKPMDAKTFAAARAAFVYHILSQIQTPLSRADNFGWYAGEGNLPYAPGSDSGAYLRAAESLDPGFVAQAARRFLQHPSVVTLSANKKSQGAAI